jgi:microsomal prostaglandin-E synthase 1
MINLAAQPAFVAYAVSLLVLSLNLLVLWAYSGAVRAKTRTTPNREDVGTVAKSAQLVETDPPEVARVLRAHKNALANSVPFAILGLVFVLAGASGTAAWAIFGVFTVARIVHSVAYLREKQPWRTLSFVLGGATTLVLMGFIVRALVAAA